MSTSTAAPARVPRRLRVATSAIYFQTGVVLAMWAVCIPQVRADLRLSPAVLGTVLLTLGAGVLAGVQLAGPLLHRVGSQRICGAGVVVFATAINLPGLAGGPLWLAGALFTLGLGCGLLDIAINDQAVRVERSYGRPIMSSIHGFYSVGGVLGAGLGTALQSAHVELQVNLIIAAAVAATTGGLAVPRLDPTVWTGPVDGSGEPPAGPDPSGRSPRSPVLVIAVLVLIFMLAEGVANDWSAVEAIERYRVARSSAALAFVSFIGAMTVGRLTVDRVVRRLGPIAVLRGGGALATLALVWVVWAPSFWVATIGWAGFGLAIAGLLPQMFTALGRVPSANHGVTMSRVVGAGYTGLLAGPSVIGWLSRLVGLRFALLLPAALCLLSLGLAHRVSARPADR